MLEEHLMLENDNNVTMIMLCLDSSQSVYFDWCTHKNAQQFAT